MFERVGFPRLVVLCSAILLLLAGCEKPFEPLAPSDLTFSIYGHLDASADTQWVRVMPIRPSLQSPPGPIDAVVTLEELETGTTVTMSDSTFRYLPMFGEAELYAHNFSTTMPMVPGRHYRLTATRSDGAAAAATVLIPAFESPTLVVSNRFRLPQVQNDPRMAETSGVVRGPPHLGMVLGREDIPARCGWPFPVHQEFLPVDQATSAAGEHRVQLSWSLDPRADQRPSYVSGRPPMAGDTIDDRHTPRGNLCNLAPKRVLVVASGEEWPFGAAARLRELIHPSSINNVEGGLGFLAGVQTHVFPYAGCIPAERRAPSLSIPAPQHWPES